MLAKFSREHWHNEDEVRFIFAGRGFHPSWQRSTYGNRSRSRRERRDSRHWPISAPLGLDATPHRYRSRSQLPGGLLRVRIPKPGYHVTRELDAATAAGVKTLLCEHPGNLPNQKTSIGGFEVLPRFVRSPKHRTGKLPARASSIASTRQHQKREPLVEVNQSTAATIKVASSQGTPLLWLCADCKIRFFNWSAESETFSEIKPSNLSSPNSTPWSSAHSVMPSVNKTNRSPLRNSSSC